MDEHQAKSYAGDAKVAVGANWEKVEVSPSREGTPKAGCVIAGANQAGSIGSEPTAKKPSAEQPCCFARLGLPPNPVMLAPLAGVSDHPFRRVCSQQGADLTYVEMLSATALIYQSKRTYDMLARHRDERILGVQLTGKTADEVGRAVAILGGYDFETIDLNMGCPVTKVTKNGSGSAILRDPERVLATVKAAVANTDKPVSAKIRLGWDAKQVTAMEVAQAAEAGGAAWLTLHGRLRSDDYSAPVDVGMMARVQDQVTIPFVGNGNIFSSADDLLVRQETGAVGTMVSRGALGNPWVFRQIKGDDRPVTLDEWLDLVMTHLHEQASAYGASGMGTLCMRKHLLWYLKGWPGGKRVRERVVNAVSMVEAQEIIQRFADDLRRGGVSERSRAHFSPSQGDTRASKSGTSCITKEGPMGGRRFSWDRFTDKVPGDSAGKGRHGSGREGLRGRLKERAERGFS